MCLAIPGKVLSLKQTDPKLADVDFGGIVKEICTECVPDAKVGDYLIVHVGFAIAKLDEAQAQKSLQLLSELSEYAEQQAPAALAESRGDSEKHTCHPANSTKQGQT